MIRSVSLRGFMNINDGRHAFAPGLNVIVAPNGAGGHNLLKLLCAVESAGAFVEAGVQVFACTHSEALADLMIGRCPPGLAARIRL